MNRLNYFNPYQTKTDYHEDQLTRAYLVLLRHSFHAFFTFFEYCRTSQIVLDSERPISLLDYIEEGWEIETQKGNPLIESNSLLSILITDSELDYGQTTIEASYRNARYDGIITFGNSLTLIIENKPRSGNVWFGQLNPSRQNLGDETSVYANPIILEWKTVIKQLGMIMTTQTISGYEKLMIEDFLSYIDEKFPFLNPYDNLSQCKGNFELINRRIKNMLLSIVKDENKVKFHRGWGYYIETPYSEIKQIGLIPVKKDQDWWLELSLFFADSQKQSKSFYSSNPQTEHLANDWEKYSNFHVSYQASNLIWFQSDDTETYLNFWKENIDKIFQQKKENVSKYVEWLAKNNIIILTEEKIKSLDDKFFDTNIPTLNICPGFGIINVLDSKEAEDFDRKGYLTKLLAEKIRDGLKVIHKTGDEFIISTSANSK